MANQKHISIGAMRYLISLVLVLSPVVFSGCKGGDTADGEKAKTEEASVASALPEKDEAAIEEAMAFLKSRKFNSISIGGAGDIPHSSTVEFMGYIEDTGELMISSQSRYGNGPTQTYVYKWTLSEMDPVFILKEELSYSTPLKKAVSMTFKGKMSIRKLPEDTEWPPSSSDKSFLMVTEADSSRIKAAVSDLLKAHGVKPSKY